MWELCCSMYVPHFLRHSLVLRALTLFYTASLVVHYFLCTRTSVTFKHLWLTEHLIQSPAWTLNYDALILSVLLYGCETLTLLKAEERKREAFLMSCQCQILGVRWQPVWSYLQPAPDSLWTRSSTRQRCSSVCHTQSGSESDDRSPTCTLETLTWPSLPFLDHTDWNGQWTLHWPCVGDGWWSSEMEGATTHCQSSRSLSEWVYL